MIEDDNTWHNGPPPAIGWYPASNSRSRGLFRWWNGQRWSFPAEEGYGEAHAESIAKTPRPERGPKMQWQHQPSNWPANARTYERQHGQGIPAG